MQVNVVKQFLRTAAMAGALMVSGVARADSGACDRQCLKGLADGLVSSIVANDPAGLPLARDYRATENSVPAALPMMTIWRTATAASNTYYVIDPVSGQLFLAATVAEGKHEALLFGRVLVRDRKFAEIELYVDRSRSDGGFQFDAAALKSLPTAWTAKVDGARLPDRPTLLAAGRAIFEAGRSSPPPAPTCVLMENGKTVAEDPDVLKAISPPGAPETPRDKLNPDGTVSIPCGMPPDRPVDPAARTSIVDEEQGIVISIATVHGLVEPYLITTPTTSAFVPHSMLPLYVDLLDRQASSGKFTQPAVQTMAASVTVMQALRIYDGKIQGMHMFQKLGPPEAVSPWTGK